MALFFYQFTPLYGHNQHFSDFWRFCSTFDVAHPKFEPAGRQKSHIFPVFCLLSSPRALNFDQPVDKNHTFPRFLSTFGTAHPEFEPAGRQKSYISSGFCLLPRPRTLNLNQPVDKNHTFPRFCLLSSPRALNFDQPVDKNHTFPPVFVYFRFRAPHFWGSNVSSSKVRCRQLRIFQSIKKSLLNSKEKTL